MHLEDLWIEIRGAGRMLRAQPWFAVAAILTFALGIGVNVAAFTISDRVLFRPLPYGTPEELVSVFAADQETRQVYFSFPSPVGMQLNAGGPFSSLGFVGRARTFQDAGSGAVRLAEASHNLLDVLEIGAHLGRGFSKQDVQERRLVALIKHEVWQARFGGDPSIVGRILTGGGQDGPAEIIGVLPKSFVPPSVNWATAGDGLIISFDTLDSGSRRGFPGLVGRLREGVSIDAAQADVNRLLASLKTTGIASESSFVLVQGLQEGLFWNVRSPLGLVYWASAGVLFIACLNIGVLVTARLEHERVATAVRCALGADRRHLVKQALVPILLIASFGSILAIATVALVSGPLLSLTPLLLRPLVLSTIDIRLVLVSSMAAAIGALLASIYPVSRIIKTDPLAILQSGAGSRKGRPKLFASLVATEALLGTVVVSFALVAGSSFLKTLRSDLGYDPKTFIVGLTSHATVDIDGLRMRLSSSPDVEAVGLADAPWGSRMAPETFSAAGGVEVRLRRVDRSYLRAYRATLLAGAPWVTDGQTAEPVAILNESAFQVFWGGSETAASIVGRSVRVPGLGSLQVVGVVQDTRDRHDVPPKPEVLVPLQTSIPTTVVVVGSRRGAVGFVDQVQTMAGGPNSVTIQTVESIIDTWLETPRLYAVTLATLGATSILLVCIGLTAVSMYEVEGRRREIAVRLAIGAQAGRIAALFLRRSMAPVAVGGGLGLVLTYWLTQVTRSILPGLGHVSPFATFGAILIFVVVGVAAVGPSIARAVLRSPVESLKE